GASADSAGAGQTEVAGPATAVAVLDREPGAERGLEPEVEFEQELEPEPGFEPVHDTEYDEEPDTTEEGKIPASDLIARLMRERQQGRDA
ncbi:MMPL family transporter, partial [Dietzia schimae]|nr:MMPL family transporter [Dietzia kunjamensis subsp. schimae]